MNKARACTVYPMIPSCQTGPGCISPAPPLAIIHHAVTHRVRGKHSSCISAVQRLPGTGTGAHCIISWFFNAQNTSSALTSSQLLYLISTELIYCESPGLYHRYNRVHVYKISYRTQCLKWNIRRIARVIRRIVLMGEESAHWKHLFIKSCFAYFII